MGFPAGVLQVQKGEQDLNAPQFVLLGFVQSRQCNQRHKNNHLCKQLYIIHEIYTNNKLPQLSSKLLFRRLLCNVTKNTVFSFNGKLYKEIDGCGMGNPLSPVLANIFMAKLEADVVRPFNPPFYDRYVDDCLSKKKKNEPDALFERLSRYHPNIVFTVEENPDHFLDTAFSYTNKFNCSVFKKPGKLPTHWKSEVPTKWKRNCITSALHRAKRISTDFDKDIKTLEPSFINAGYPKRFISHTINNFLNDSPQVTTSFRIFSSKNERKFSSSSLFAQKRKTQ